MENIDKHSHENHGKEENVAPRKYEIVWIMVFYFSYINIAGVYGLVLAFTSATWPTIAFTLFMLIVTPFGVTAGAHRLWTHKTYKAKIPLQIFLMLVQSAMNQHSLITWARDHILHHKYSDTDADPHNARRGLFYSHLGWLMVRKHPEAREKGALMDLTELYANPVLRFQQKHYGLLVLCLTFIIPTLIPLLWTETFFISHHINILRIAINSHQTFAVNRFAHKFGNKPYDESILPAQNKAVSFVAFGEGFHNYHHVFPQDYRTAELGDNYLNLTTKFIDFCAWIGQAYDRKSVSEDVVRARMVRTGQ